VKLKAVLLLFLLFFASAATIALISISIAPNNFRTTSLTSLFNIVEPTGGGPVDDPTAT